MTDKREEILSDIEFLRKKLEAEQKLCFDRPRLRKIEEDLTALRRRAREVCEGAEY